MEQRGLSKFTGMTCEFLNGTTDFFDAIYWNRLISCWPNRLVDSLPRIMRKTLINAEFHREVRSCPRGIHGKNKRTRKSRKGDIVLRPPSNRPSTSRLSSHWISRHSPLGCDAEAPRDPNLQLDKSACSFSGPQDDWPSIGRIQTSEDGFFSWNGDAQFIRRRVLLTQEAPATYSHRMRGLSTLLVAGLWFSTIVSIPGAEIREFSGEKEISRLLLTEDGAHLILAHHRDDLVTILDAITLEVVKTHEVEKPGPMVERKGLLYVSESETGLLKVFSAADEWEFTDEIDSGIKNAILLSAPLREHFKGEVIASGSRAINLVNIENDTHQTIRAKDSDFAKFTADGKYVIESDGSELSAFEVDAFRSRSAKPLQTHRGSRIAKHGWQVGPGDLWFTIDGVATGLPPRRYMKDQGVVVPDNDPTSGIAYVVNQADSVVSIHQLNSSFSSIDTTPIVGIDIERVYNNYQTAQDGRSFAQMVDGVVRIYMRGDDRGKLAVVEFPFTPPIYAHELADFKRELPPADSYELDSGPEGMSIDAKGVLTWSPKSEVEPGSYPIKVRMKREGKLSFHRDTFELQSAQSGNAIQLESDEAVLSRSARHDGIGVSDRSRWLDISPEGEITGEVRFPSDYKRIVEAQGDKGFVALGAKNVDFLSIDGKTLQQSIDLEGLEPLRILPERSGQTYLVSTTDPAAGDVLQTYPIIRIDPDKGSFERLTRVMGAELISNRAGDLLLASISHRTHHSVGFLDTRIVEIDLLMGYRHTGRAIGPDEIEAGRLKRINSLTLSSDDQHLAVGAHSIVVGGQMTYGKFPIYKYPNFERPTTVVSSGGNLRDINAHPHLPVFAVLAVEGSFGQESSKLSFVKPSGETLGHWLPEAELPMYGAGVCFAGNGKALFLKARDKLGRVELKKFDLSLSELELKDIEAGPPSPEPAFSGTPIAAADDPDGSAPATLDSQGIAQWQFERLCQIQTNQIPSEHLTRFLGPTVAMVIGGEGRIGTGFFLTGNGYLLTAAHCLAPFGPTMVACHVDLPYEKTETVRKAVIVDVDEELDLALLKIDVDMNLWHLRMRLGQANQGEEVFVIGHPGMGQISLDNTRMALPLDVSSVFEVSNIVIYFA